MKFGFCYIPDYHGEVHGDYRAWYGRMLDEWRAADRLGFDCAWIAEHRYAGYGFSSTPVMAQAMADATERLRVGTAVALLPQRHPILAAEHWAAVDLLSGGRLNFGIGRGIFAYDFEVMAQASSESRERFEEAWEIIRRLWTEPSVTHEGKYWPFRDHALRPQPLQRPMPPVYVACVASPESYEWAGKNGFHVMTSPFLLDSTERQRQYLELYRETLSKHGHDPAAFEVLGNYHLFVVEREADLARADEYLFNYLAVLAGTANINKLDQAGYAHYKPGEGMFMDVAEMRAKRTIIGTAAQCRERIAELAEACGLTGWMFHLNYGKVPAERVLDEMEIFAHEVMPAFAADARATAPASA
jgi:alkanesulfonate monooxygenase SsuD/methylene tetrahydromethanopterin reductase-like flavin-dependent oxidoreductase (luciferase family)